MTSSAIRPLENAFGTGESSGLRHFAVKAFAVAFILLMTLVLLAGTAWAGPVMGC